MSWKVPETILSHLNSKGVQKMSRNPEFGASVLALDIELSESERAQLLAAFMTSIKDIELLYTTSGLDC